MNVASKRRRNKSVYAPRPDGTPVETHILAVIVVNEPGVLARVVGLFSGRGYNIESLTVAEIDHDQSLSRITIVSSGTSDVLQQIELQLGRLVPVLSVRDITTSGPFVERELILLRVSGDAAHLQSAKDTGARFSAAVVREDDESCILEFSGHSTQIEEFLDAMLEFDMVCVSRTGVAALSCSKESLHT